MASENSAGQTLAQEKALDEKKQVLGDISRDIVTIVAAIITLVAFAFAIWATVSTLQQGKKTDELDARIALSLERIERRILRTVDENNEMMRNFCQSTAAAEQMDLESV